jgi:threonine dehydrogenase-like Zn-dependent dehydrogenase
VKGIKPGDRVGVGAQVQSCMKCPQCKSDNENYCPHMVGELICPRMPQKVLEHLNSLPRIIVPFELGYC